MLTFVYLTQLNCSQLLAVHVAFSNAQDLCHRFLCVLWLLSLIPLCNGDEELEANLLFCGEYRMEIEYHNLKPCAYFRQKTRFEFEGKTIFCINECANLKFVALFSVSYFQYFINRIWHDVYATVLGCVCLQSRHLQTGLLILLICKRME